MIRLPRARGTLRRCLAVLALTVVSTTVTFQGASARSEAASPWTGTWEAAPSGTAPALPDASIRNVVHISVGGTAVRIHVSNRLGTAPLQLDTVTVALQRPVVHVGPDAVPGSVHSATFAGATSVTVPVGEDRVSDPVGFRVPAEADLLVTVHTPGDFGPATFHETALQTNFIAEKGNRAADTDGAAYTRTVSHWYYVTGVDVLGPAAGSVVAFGDSLTDGTGSSYGTNHRWPDLLSERLRKLPESRRPGILNAGIGGNRLLLDGTGPNALARLDADALSRSGVRTLIVLEGINDLIVNPPQMDPGAYVQAYRRIVSRAHAHGIHVVGATLTPFGGHGTWTPEREAVRTEVNARIRGKLFDTVADFDAAVRDPANPARILPAYDPGDHLHFNDAGMSALADTIDPAFLGR
ncbi:SGNH/GDSL hydrolase family protein [Streptomyces colonosanans]|uniref:SGNH hydrolase n=1 Tax=Streptomyces colonosanans TaxID=1428652 RepID=A0A1S2P473_9ACTN|nr:SGNH/GDSL hydrolase family protein [Streptomyces colonosanans]OIJ88478.1 SGNH hydrolase [Streptomyces colonosanans]